MRIGTCNFVNFTKACDYYKDQGYGDLSPAELEAVVRDKLQCGQIHLGKPDVEVGQRLIVIDDGCRYGLED